MGPEIPGRRAAAGCLAGSSAPRTRRGAGAPFGGPRRDHQAAAAEAERPADDGSALRQRREVHRYPDTRALGGAQHQRAAALHALDEHGVGEFAAAGPHEQRGDRAGEAQCAGARCIARRDGPRQPRRAGVQPAHVPGRPALFAQQVRGALRARPLDLDQPR